MFFVMVASSVARLLGAISLPALAVGVLLVRMFGSDSSTKAEVRHSPGAAPRSGAQRGAPRAEPSGTPAPGWYPDPGGSFGDRWWDGAQWTEQLREPSPFR